MTSYPSRRYRCDHCKKTSGSAPAMRKHERGCTANPARAWCGMCAASGNTPQPVPDLVAALGKGDADGLRAVRDLASGCPACILTAIRHSKLQRPSTGIDDDGFRVDFDFKAETKDWWACVNDSRRRDGYY